MLIKIESKPLLCYFLYVLSHGTIWNIFHSSIFSVLKFSELMWSYGGNFRYYFSFLIITHSFRSNWHSLLFTLLWLQIRTGIVFRLFTIGVESVEHWRTYNRTISLQNANCKSWNYKEELERHLGQSFFGDQRWVLKRWFGWL